MTELSSISTNIEIVDNGISNYISKVLIINSKDVSSSDLLERLLKEGVDKSVQNDEEQNDLVTSLLDLTLKGNDGENIATVTLDISTTSKRINHSSALKNSYRASDNVLFVFNASSR
jgi:hypothetical protein